MKHQISLLILLVAIVSACSASPSAASTTASGPTPTFSAPPSAFPTIAASTTPSPVPVHAQQWSLGPDNAFLTITLYGDFQAPLCLDVARSLEIIREKYPNDVRLVWRNFPQPGNDKALLAAQAAEAAAAQGKFWEMHDQLLANQTDWSKLTVQQFHDKLADYIKLIGLDSTKFYAAVDGGAALPDLQAAISDAQLLGLKGAPVLVFNAAPYSGRIDLSALDSYTQLQLLQKRAFAHQPDLQIDLSKQYTATLTTEKGVVKLALDAKAAPVTVNNFVFLAKAGWYNAITFHLVLPGQFVQTGDPSGSGFGGPGYTIVDEHNNGLKFNTPGQVAMASDPNTPNSGGSQFFITLGPMQPELSYDGQFTIFGHVISGLDVLSKLTPRNPFDQVHYPNPPPGDKLISVTIDSN